VTRRAVSDILTASAVASVTVVPKEDFVFVRDEALLLGQVDDRTQCTAVGGEVCEVGGEEVEIVKRI